MKFGGQTMVGRLLRAMVCTPEAAGWSDASARGAWRELGYLREPNPAEAREQHAAMCQALEAAGVEIVPLMVEPASNGAPARRSSLDAVYVHDPSFMTDRGAILLAMGKEARVGEVELHREFYRAQGIPVLGEVVAPGKVEAGDIVWLDEQTLLVGRGYRTNEAGIAQLRALLAPHGVDVLSAPLPYFAGPSACLHLMSLMSLLDARTVLVDLEYLAVETVELLEARGFALIRMDPAERATLGCNVLALGGKRLLALEENPRTNLRLRLAGFEVETFPGSEIGINGGGGPTCLTRPLARAAETP